MIKKITAYLFVLIATTVLVAHAVVPHHHHHVHRVFIITEHNDEDDFGHKHPANEHSHEHSDANDYDFCLLNQVITTPANSSKQEFSSPFIDFNFGNVLAIVIKNDFACNPPPILSYRQTPFHNSFYTCFINSVSGSRAPPSV